MTGKIDKFMKGKIAKILFNRPDHEFAGKKYGFIKGDDGKEYYFNERSIADGYNIDDFKIDDIVEFQTFELPNKQTGTKNISLLNNDMDLKDLIEKIGGATTYKEKSIMMLEYMRFAGVVEKNDDIWTFRLREPSCKEYSDCQLSGFICARNMCDNIFEAISEKKIDIPDEISDCIGLIDAVFPEGENSNYLEYFNQGDDFGIRFDKDKDHPSLLTIKKAKSDLLTSLMKALAKTGKPDFAIEIFKLYSNKYWIKLRSLFVGIMYAPISDLDKLNDFDLGYLLAGIEAETKNDGNREKSFLQTVKKLCDAGVKIEAPTSIKNDKLLNELSKLNDTFRVKKLSDEARYYLSVLIREYSDIRPSDNGSDCDYNIKLKDLKSEIEKILDKREKQYIAEILGDIDENRDKTDELFIRFLKSCENCKNYSNYENFPDDKIPDDEKKYKDLYNKVKKNNVIVKYIAAAQKRIENIKGINLNSGDLTFLICVQVKIVERFLKEVIIQNMENETVYKEYQDGNPKKDTKDANKLFIDNQTTCEEFSFEIGPVMLIIYYNWEKCKDINSTNNDRDYFNGRNKKEPSLAFWRDKVRNGYFHVHPVKTISEAEEIHNKTAFCLMRCISSLKPLKK